MHLVVMISVLQSPSSFVKLVGFLDLPLGDGELGGGAMPSALAVVTERSGRVPGLRVREETGRLLSAFAMRVASAWLAASDCFFASLSA